MRHFLPLVLTVALLGCESGAKIGDPVAPPPPPRIEIPEGSGADAGSAGGSLEIQQVSGTTVRGESATANGDPEPTGAAASVTSAVASADPGAALSASHSAAVPGEGGDEQLAAMVVARVGKEVIFARDCIEPIRPQLAEARGRMSAEEFAPYRDKMIRGQLRALVERKLLLAEMQRELAEPQMKMLRAEASRQFQEKLRDLMNKTGASTESELDAILRAQGIRLDRLRNSFEGNVLAEQFLRTKLTGEIVLSRQELLDYYQAHRDEFRRPARVRWQQIELPWSALPSKAAAMAKADELAGMLAAGADFGVLARMESKGPLAQQGGQWEWTTRGSYADAVVDRALFELPVGQTSSVLEGKSGFHLVKVLERQEEGIEPFDEVQQEIHAKLRRERMREAASAYLERLVERIPVETVFGPIDLKGSG